MTTRRVVSSLVAAAFAVVTATAHAQTTGQKPFEPQVGLRVNLEIDLVARYIERLLPASTSASES